MSDRVDVIRLHCGSCGRVLARIDRQSAEELFAEMDAGVDVDSRRWPGSPKERRRQFGGGWGRGVIDNFYCHPKRCGRQHSINDSKIRPAIEHAHALGRDFLIAGHGNYARGHGGPDI